MSTDAGGKSALSEYEGLPRPAATRRSHGLGPLAEEAGMVDLLNMGAASCVYSHGCNGVTQEHLEKFAALLMAAHAHKLRTLLARYRDETPVEHQPHIIAHQADEVLGRT